MRVRGLDSLTLTVSDVVQATRFYHEILDMPIIEDQTDNHMTTLRCGHQLLHLQQTNTEVKFKAKKPTVGAADLCIVVRDKIDDIENHLKSYFVNIVVGPITTIGSEGKMHTIFITDNDQNMIAVGTYK